MCCHRITKLIYILYSPLKTTNKLLTYPSSVKKIHKIEMKIIQDFNTVSNKFEDVILQTFNRQNSLVI